METTNDHKPHKNENEQNTAFSTSRPEKEEVQFENPSTDPGFERNDEDPEEWNDELKDDLNAAANPKKIQPDQQNDALNYNNDRENGAYNPKNI